MRTGKTLKGGYSGRSRGGLRSTGPSGHSQAPWEGDGKSRSTDLTRGPELQIGEPVALEGHRGRHELVDLEGADERGPGLDPRVVPQEAAIDDGLATHDAIAPDHRAGDE